MSILQNLINKSTLQLEVNMEKDTQLYDKETNSLIKDSIYKTSYDLEDPQPIYIRNKSTDCQKFFRKYCDCIYSPLPIIIKNILSYYSTPSSQYLTKEEAKRVNLIKKQSSEAYDQSNKSHEERLNQLKIIVNNLLDSQNEDEIWTRIGFQSSNPRTDFRGGGVKGLDFILFFIRNFNSDFQQMIEKEYFLFGIVAIKVSYLVRLFIGIYDNDYEYRLNLRINKIDECSKFQFKSFCKYLSFKDEFLNIITSKALISVKEYYVNKLFDKSKKELNFTLVDKAIYDAGVGFVSYFLNQKREVSKLDFDENIDYRLSEFLRDKLVY